MLHFTFVVSSLLSTDFFFGKRTSFTFNYFQILLLFPEPFPWFGRGREKAPFPAPPQAREKALGKRLPVPDTNVVSLKFKFSNYYKISQLRTFERNFPNIDFFSLNFHHCKMMSLLCQKCHRAECLLFSEHLLAVLRSVILPSIIQISAKSRVSLVKINARFFP